MTATSTGDEPAQVQRSSEAPGGQDGQEVRGSGRARALARSARFMAAALALVEESGRADFTVQTLVDRSNLSLRAFYQHFAGKDELLLALYEDVTNQFTQDIRQDVAAAGGPMERLEAFCRGYMSRAESSHRLGGRIVTIYNLSLEIERPEEFAKVWEPLQRLLMKIITLCAQADLVRRDLTPAELTVLLNSTLTALGQAGVLHPGNGAQLTADHMWAWCRQAVSPVQGRMQTQPVPRPRRASKSRKSTT